MKQPGAQAAAGLARFAAPESARVAGKRNGQAAALLPLQALQPPALGGGIGVNIGPRLRLVYLRVVGVVRVFNQQRVRRKRQGIDEAITLLLVNRGVHQDGALKAVGG